MSNNENSIKKYRQNILSGFLNKVLEIEKEDAIKNAIEIEQVLSEEVAIKLVHFADCLLQYSSNSDCSKSSQCGSCCGNCNCK